MRGHLRQVEVARFLDRLTAVHRLEHGEFARFFLNDSRDAEEIFSTLAARHSAPRFFEGAPRGGHRVIDIGSIRLRDLRELLFVRGIDRGKISGAFRRDKFAADEEFVVRRDLTGTLSGAGA